MAWEKLLTFGGYALSQVDETYEQLISSYGATNLVLGNVPSAITGPGDWTVTTGEGRWDVSSRLYVTTAFNTGWGVLNGRQAWGWTGLAYSGVAADFVWYINHEEEKANMFFICKLVGSWGTTTTPNSATETDQRNLYAELMRIAHVWTSVKTIRGKNGSFRLSDILNINEGEAVNDVPAAGNVNFTKKTKLDTLINGALETDGNPTKATVSFTLPNATYSFAKLVYKLGQMPEDEDDGVTIDITPDDSVAKIEDLEQDKSYWFAIFTNKTESNAVEYRTGEVSDEYYEFDYTGSIQTFTAPKTGYYQIETWGAQGGNATDGTNSARGGYGAYAVGEVLLNEGETIYINVGGQNGYGGGGNYVAPLDPSDYESILAFANTKIFDATDGYDSFWWKDWPLVVPAYWVRNVQIDAWLNHSYYRYQNDDFIHTGNTGETSLYAGRIFGSTNILDVNIDYVDGNYVGVVNNIDYIQNMYYEYMQSSPSTKNYTDSIDIYQSSQYSSAYQNAFYNVGYSTTPTVPTSHTYSNSDFATVLEHFTRRFHNVNIYVNGVQWATAGQ